jgi:hypothetical protein
MKKPVVTLSLVAANLGVYALDIWHAIVGGGGDVSFGCHLGGFFAGFIVVLLLRASGSEVLEGAQC